MHALVRSARCGGSSLASSFAACSSSRALHSAAPLSGHRHHPPTVTATAGQPAESVAPAATPASPAAAAAAPGSVPQRRTGNSAADLRRIFREQQRASFNDQEAFPWEKTEQKITAWEPKYEDERKFYFASKVKEGQHNLTPTTLRRYMDGFGGKYLLSKRTPKSGAFLKDLKMASPKQMQVELVASGNVLNYWFLHLTANQQPKNTVPAQLDTARVKTKDKQVLKVTLSRENQWRYLVALHELWPRKDERDIKWAALPRTEHGQYRLMLSRVLAEGASRPLNNATQSFIDHIQYQVSFHFRERDLQGRNLHWLQFMGVPGVRISKKWGGEIKIPKLNVGGD